MSDTPDGSIITWVLAGVATLIGGLATTVTALWKVNETRNAKRIDQLEQNLAESNKKHDECMDDRNTLREECVEMRVRLEMLEQNMKKP